MESKYVKDFDGWNVYQKQLEETKSPPIFNEREIWWCALGINTGSEQDGKNAQFERPVIIIRKVNSELLIIVPITSKIRKDKFRAEIKHGNEIRDVLLSQVRVISNKRLLRMAGTLKQNAFLDILIRLSVIILENR